MLKCFTSSPPDSSPWVVPPAGQRQLHSPHLCLFSKAACSLLPPTGIRIQIGFSKVKLVQAGKGQEIWGDLDFTCFLPSPSCSPHSSGHNAKESRTGREVMDHRAKPFMGLIQARHQMLTPELRGEGQASSAVLWEEKEGLQPSCSPLTASPSAAWNCTAPRARLSSQRLTLAGAQLPMSQSGDGLGHWG